MSALHTDYRPKKLDDVVGQREVIKALDATIRKGSERAFLFYGPSGTGKTTLARITARAIGCEDKDLIDVDAATHTGIDAMRELKQLTRYRAFGESPWRGLLIDECHRLSAQAWDSLLKALEEPPEHVLWLLCTTEFNKVPATIKRRCMKLALAPVQEADLRKLLAKVAAAENMKMPREVQDIVIRMAQGSPGQMLMNMATCRAAEDRAEAVKLLRDVQESDKVADLCKFLLRGGGSWPAAAVLIEKLAEENPESVRIGVCNYLGGALRRARSEKEACAILGVLDPFTAPFPAGTDRAMLTVAVGRAMYAQ